MTNANQMFSSCSNLETIYATSFINTGLPGSFMFNSCTKLVGGTDGFAPMSTSDATVCKLGSGGVLTDPNNNQRSWFWAHFYKDGEAVLTATRTPEANRSLRATGRICTIGKYQGSGSRPRPAIRAARTGSTSRARGLRRTWPLTRT